MRNPNGRAISDIKMDDDLGSEKWNPLIVIGNKKSGNKDCISILAAFRSQLNPAQVSVMRYYCVVEEKTPFNEILHTSCNRL